MIHTDIKPPISKTKNIKNIRDIMDVRRWINEAVSLKGNKITRQHREVLYRISSIDEPDEALQNEALQVLQDLHKHDYTPGCVKKSITRITEWIKGL